MENIFVDCSLVLPIKDTMPPNLIEKPPQIATKFSKVFSLESFPLYGMECI